MGSLRPFNNLKHIRVNVAMFCDECLEKQKEQGIYVGSVIHSGQGIDGNGIYLLLVMIAMIPQQMTLQLLPFVDILPASIEKLTLVGIFTKNEATLLFSGMSTLKGERLPNSQKSHSRQSLPARAI